MITEVEFSVAPLTPGEQRSISAWTDAAPLTVKVRCFVEHPPPAKYKPCKECGTFTVGSGEALHLVASMTAFRETGGTLVVTVTDQAQDTRAFEVYVHKEDDLITWATPAVEIEG